MQQGNVTLLVGDARVTTLNAGNLRLLLSAEMAVPEAVWRPTYADLFERPGVCPSLSVYVEAPGAHVLVDIGDYRATVTPDSEYALADYTPPPPITEQLASLGVKPEDITHVVLTHSHWDHYAGVTTASDTGPALRFPRATYYLGAADWADAEMQTALRDPDSLEARTLGVLQARGVLRLIEGREPIAAGIEILPAPGETPGHQIVRVQSNGETLYIVGDLFHHNVELEHPDWMVTWADPATMLATRRWVMRDAQAERATIIAAHLFGAGRIAATDGGGTRWSAV
ncbi:MAG TPA: MBL fold metallo-hydrolase [Ktedonobacterales bacterium]|nr:MBL fold metallo-hydrolase [Ktedonobacterales bacterium]